MKNIFSAVLRPFKVTRSVDIDMIGFNKFVVFDLLNRLRDCEIKCYEDIAFQRQLVQKIQEMPESITKFSDEDKKTLVIKDRKSILAECITSIKNIKVRANLCDALSSTYEVLFNYNLHQKTIHPDEVLSYGIAVGKLNLECIAVLVKINAFKTVTDFNKEIEFYFCLAPLQDNKVIF